jgi:hypothetical protein
MGRLNQEWIVIHEAAHFAFQGIDHFAMEYPDPHGRPYPTGTQHVIKRTKNYAQLNYAEAVQNADSYAQFALHAFMRADKRLIRQGPKAFSE